MSTKDVSRRGFMTAAAGTAAAAAASGTAAAQIPEFDAYLNDANGFEETNVSDLRGEESVTIQVGAGEQGLAFDPAAVWVDAGTTVTWEWTGEGGAHNVVANEGPAGLDSGDPVGDEGETYEYEFTEEDAGVTTYKCEPHEGQGMKGGVAVGEDVPTFEPEAGGPAIEIPDQALALTVATLIAMATTLSLGYFFMRYGGDYDQ